MMELAVYGVSSAVSASLLALSILLFVPTQCFSQAAPTVATATAVSLTEQQLLSQFKRIEGRGTLPDVRSYVLEQPAGRTWRTFHDVYLRWIAVGAIFSILAVLTIYYLWHGTIRFEGGRAARKMLRFTAYERFVHWLTALSFGVLAITGLNLTFGKKVLLPWMGPEAYSAWASAAKYAHNFISFSFTLGILLMFSIWVSNNFPQRADIEWLRHGGGMFGGKEPPVGRFNTGEKFIFWMSVIAGAILATSGYVLLFPFWGTAIGPMQIAQVVHSVVAMLFIAGMFVHMYMGTIGTEGAFESMISGEVDVNWAKSHHILWYAEETARGSDTRPRAGAHAKKS
jgi:formate dehydrogenase subunit gamma